MDIGTVCNRNILITAKSTSVAVAAKLMRVFGEHALLIADEKDGKLFAVGMLTEEQIVCGIVANEADPAALTVADIMSADVASVSESGSVFDAIRLMYEKHLKQVAVIDEVGGIVGVVTTDRLFENMAEELLDVSAPVQDQRSTQRKVTLH